MSVADEGIGASIWLPTKDIWSDEPENGIIMKIITPPDLTGIGNGRLINRTKKTEKIFSHGKLKTRLTLILSFRILVNM